MDVKGNVVDVKGYVVDVKGCVVDVKSYAVDFKGYVVDVKGYVKGYVDRGVQVFRPRGGPFDAQLPDGRPRPQRL